MQDRPTAAELLEALREFLERDVLTSLEGRRKFHTRVAINVVRILERELAGEDAALRAEWERLGQPVTVEGTPARDAVEGANRILAARIRSGDLDDRWDETLEAVRETVVDKLRIANPAWLADPDLKAEPVGPPDV
jgi:hypothetical protein